MNALHSIEHNLAAFVNMTNVGKTYNTGEYNIGNIIKDVGSIKFSTQSNCIDSKLLEFQWIYQIFKSYSPIWTYLITMV